MMVHFKITPSLLDSIRQDLHRPHPYAYERVGFISCRVGGLAGGDLIILAHAYHPVEDDEYLCDRTVGAMMGPAAIRKALQRAYNEKVSTFHVHMHDHAGPPRFSITDLTEADKFVPDFWNVQPDLPHGALVLSHDSLIGICWVPVTRKKVQISEITVVGAPLTRIRV